MPDTKMRTAALLGVLIAGAMSQPLWAHHSFAVFDMDKTIVLEGTVKEFQWTNPHVWLELLVTNPAQGIDQWSIEGGYTGGLKRNGWTRDSFKVGDKVQVTMHPLRNGGNGGSFVQAILADGSSLQSFKNGAVLGEKTPPAVVGKPAP
jgi:hypothetical protein